MKSKLMAVAIMIAPLAGSIQVKASISDGIKKTVIDTALNNKKKIALLSIVGLAYGLWQLYPSLMQWSATDPVVQELGYNPDPQNRHADIATMTNNKVTLAMHGFENPNYSMEDDPCKPKDMKIIACNPKTSCALPNPISFVRSINFGQEKDALVILRYLILLSGNKNIQKINGLGESRGGAAWIRALKMLSTPKNMLLHGKNWIL